MFAHMLKISDPVWSAWRWVALLALLGLPLACDRTLTEPEKAPPLQASSIFAPPPPPKVNPMPQQLAFTVQPTTAEGAEPMSPSVRVAIVNLVTGLPGGGTVTLTLSPNTAGAKLFGTTAVNASGGVATFSNLRVDRPGTGYTLVASGANAAAVTSAPFAVHLNFTAVSAGVFHTCGLTIGHAAYCWGDNTYGQLGDARPETQSPSPVLVAGGLTFSVVSAGGHTCGVTTGGATYCWGENQAGQLGDGTATGPQQCVPSGVGSCSTTPVAVASALTFATVSAGASHTCGLTTAGAAYCWGDNTWGQLGDAGTETQSPSPVPVAGGLTFSVLSAGGGHTCGVTAGGATYCWGDNVHGALGDGGTEMRSASPVLVAGGLSFAAVSAGAFQTCGLTTSGTAYCWGWNLYGELGYGQYPGTNGTEFQQVTPVPVFAGFTYVALSAGGYHTCAFTITLTYCWGRDYYGELGNGTTTGITGGYPSPVLVGSGTHTFTAVSAGFHHSCAVGPGDLAYCWGDNTYGQLGNGTTANSSLPVGVVQ